MENRKPNLDAWLADGFIDQLRADIQSAENSLQEAIAEWDSCYCTMPLSGQEGATPRHPPQELEAEILRRRERLQNAWDMLYITGTKE
jgi:hypothetical protein